jgi:DNA-binding MarR family transcriptional regulator
MADKSELGHELKRTRSFHSISQEAVLSVLRTASMVKRSLEATVGQGGVTSQQYNILRILRGARGELPVMEIAARMIEVEPGITRLIRRLEKKELVSWRHGDADSRVKLCSITPKGLQVLDDLDDVVSSFDNTALGRLDNEELSTLIRILEKARKKAIYAVILLLTQGPTMSRLITA